MGFKGLKEDFASIDFSIMSLNAAALFSQELSLANSIRF
jgi:hypothetical protein